MTVVSSVAFIDTSNLASDRSPLSLLESLVETVGLGNSWLRRGAAATGVVPRLDPTVKEAFNVAYNNIYAFHLAQKSVEQSVENMKGVRCKRVARSIGSVGLYVPGGTAVLPSTALMLAVPAQIAGCKTVVLATPPGQDGSICKEVLYCAKKAGVTHILKAGGAQAISAMAWGTESCPKVEKILGPGNQYVTAAKMILQNSEAMISIDMPAGPSEVLVIADKHASPVHIAADLLSQAEHGPDSQVVLVIAGEGVDFKAIEEEISKQCQSLPRGDFASKALGHSFTVFARDMVEAITFSNLYAPEHLIMNVKDAEKWEGFVENAVGLASNITYMTSSLLPKPYLLSVMAISFKLFVPAGSVFLGQWTPESVGDYASGTNHVLPTYGYARMYGGVSLDSFLKCMTIQSLTEEGLRNLGPYVATMAEVEGLDAHKRAVTLGLQVHSATILFSVVLRSKALCQFVESHCRSPLIGNCLLVKNPKSPFTSPSNSRHHRRPYTPTPTPLDLSSHTEQKSISLSSSKPTVYRESTEKASSESFTHRHGFHNFRADSIVGRPHRHFNQDPRSVSTITQQVPFPPVVVFFVRHRVFDHRHCPCYPSHAPQCSIVVSGDYKVQLAGKSFLF
ncbi:Histidinol dehydrogenase [Hibiscus syriacus]|uniref:Histidinol dehydrogenase, chloroplastic n=1 Tax=Hibiscus syriacus TaxID=106335 RepID=A0A6A3AF34_HIBSY|nr:Histidinol dehydrogenase [Hibiscus syriacus]